MDPHEPVETTEKLFGRIRSRKYQGWVRAFIYLAIFGTFIFLLGTHRLDRFENMVLDGLVGKLQTKQVHPEIALIEISEPAIAEIGPWPWPRSYHAIMLRLLDEWKAAAIVFDLDLSEPSEVKDDLDLAQVFAKLRTPVYLSAELRPPKEKKFWVHGMPVVLDEGEGKAKWVRALPQFEKHAKAVGHRHLDSDPDGILRRFAPSLSDGKNTYPFLPLPPAYDFLKRKMPTATQWNFFEDAEKKVIIPWTSVRGKEFVRYSYADLIHSFYAIQKGLKPVVDPRKIEGKICLVGLTARNEAEFKATSFDLSYPALGVYAQVLGSALTGSWIRPAPFWLNLFCLVGVGIIATFFFVALRGVAAFLAGLLLGAGWLLFCLLAFYQAHLWFYAIYLPLLILCLFIFSAVYVQIMAAKEKSHLFHLATRDGLTELYVIRHFRVIMNQVVREATVSKEPLSIILFDIDNFKKINDTYGHPAGDLVLKKIATLVLRYIRKKRAFHDIDFAARYGGEEFIVMLRKSSLKETALLAAERIRKAVESEVFEWEGKNIPVTISVGVATLHPGENVPDPMVHRADAALYQAKQTGKNRVCTE